MSTTLFDAGDIQRLDRERQLTEQAPRQLPKEPDVGYSDDDFGDMLLDALIGALEARLNKEL